MNYDNQFTANPENELRTYALSLPNGPANYEMTLQPASTKIRTPPPNPPAMAGPRHGHPIDGLYSCDWAAADPNNGVARVTLDLKTDSTAGHFRKFRHAMVLDFTNNPAEGFQAYFLPWDGRGGAVHMTLPAGGHRHFFTAALSGCSVMVAGAPNNPTVYHAGVDSWENSPYTQDPHSNATPVANITPQLWEDLVEHVIAGAPAAKIDKTDYVNDNNPPPQTTADSRTMEQLLQQAKDDQNATATPWGSVCGIRNGAGNWTFYLQENITMQWSERRGRWGLFRYLRHGNGRIRVQDSACRPIQVHQFFSSQNILTRLWDL